MSEKTAVLLANLGGPDSLAAVEPFLYNLFSDPDIFKFPFPALTQKLFAWSVAKRRASSVQEMYNQLGGRSPILPLTESQALTLQTQLAAAGEDIPVYVTMRYWHPLMEETVDKILADGVTHLILLPLYPQYSHTTTGSTLNELRRVLATKKGVSLKLSVIPQFYEHPGYLKALAQSIQEGLDDRSWGCPPEAVQILFSAHSLPLKFVEKTQDPYPQQIIETAQSVMQQYFPQNRWELAYQSKVGRMAWLGPPTDGVLAYFAGKGIDNILIVPISFVSDHLETLYELDRMYIPEAMEMGLRYCHRAPSFNSQPQFIRTLAQLVQDELNRPAPPPTMTVTVNL